MAANQLSLYFAAVWVELALFNLVKFEFETIRLNSRALPAW